MKNDTGVCKSLAHWHWRIVLYIAKLQVENEELKEEINKLKSIKS